MPAADVREIARLTTRNFFGPIQTIIPWASNHYTETLIDLVRGKFGGDYWGFLMLGGISGGGMGFIVDPARRTEAQDFLQGEMVATKRRLQTALPFAMDPVVYDFAINDRGTLGELCSGGDAMMPAAYYAICAPEWLRQETRQLSPAVRNEITRFAATCRTHPRLAGSTEMLLGALFPRPSEDTGGEESLKSVLAANGFDAELHEQIRSDLRTGRIGLAQNRLPPSTVIEDVAGDDVWDTCTAAVEAADQRAGEAALAGGEVAVLALAGGAGSRWTRGAGVVKALHPFCRFQSKYRNFIEIHLAKGRKTGARFGARRRRSWYRPAISRTSPSSAFCNRRRAGPIPGRCWPRRAVRSGCGWSPCPATCALPGRKCRSRSSTCRPKRSARACTPR